MHTPTLSRKTKNLEHVKSKIFINPWWQSDANPSTNQSSTDPGSIPALESIETLNN